MIPLRLVLENFISHVNSELDFSKFDAALLVGEHKGNPYVSNGVGKSAIFDSMRWALTNKSRFSTKDKVVKRGKAQCKVIFEFMIEGDIYRIIRRIDKRSGITDVSFYKKVGDKWEDDGLTCDTSTMTNRKIIEIIKMSDDTFVNSVYFKQNDISGFASATTSKRKEILKEVLQIGIWDDFQQMAKDSVKHFEAQRDNLEERLKIVGDVKSQKNDNEVKTKEMGLKIAEVDKELDTLDKELDRRKQLSSSLETVIAQKGGFDFIKLKEEKKSLSVRANEIKQKRSELREQIKNNNEVASNACEDYKVLQDKLFKLCRKVAKVSRVGEKKISEIVSKFNIEKMPSSQYNQDSIAEKKCYLRNHRDILSALKQELVNINAIQPGKECPTCLSKIDNPKDIAERRKKRKRLIKSKIQEEKIIIERLFSEITKEQNIVDGAKESLIELERTELMMAKKSVAYSESIHSNEIIQMELKSLDISWKKIREEYVKTRDILNNLKEGANIYVELEKAKTERDKLSSEIELLKKKMLELSVQHGMLKGYGEELERRISERGVINNQLSTVLREIDIYKNLSKAFGKDGIQAIIMENITEDLKKYANSVLKQICSDPMSIDFVTQKQTGVGSWKEQFDIRVSSGSSELDFDDLSGGEQVRISIALRLALSQLLMRRVGSNVKFLLLDEVDQALDRHGIDALATAVLTLSKNLKILVITHNETMKEKFDSIITIQKGPAGSILKQ